jgi:hypothetical protein
MDKSRNPVILDLSKPLKKAVTSQTELLSNKSSLLQLLGKHRYKTFFTIVVSLRLCRKHHSCFSIVASKNVAAIF